MNKDPLKIIIWMNIASHHQRSFFNELRESGIELIVFYYGLENKERLIQGWESNYTLPNNENHIGKNRNDILSSLWKWKDYIHIIPGYGERYLRILALRLSKEKIKWIHWSEPAHPGFRWLITFPIKRWYANLINKYALGTFANGVCAMEDIRRWGVKSKSMAILPYSIPMCVDDGKNDIVCEEFLNGNRAFIFLGKLCERKGISVLMRAFAQIVKDNSQWRLLVIGHDGGSNKYIKLAKKLNISDKMLFRGSISSNSINNVLRLSSVLVLPSLFDGWGASLIEAASMGLALISSNRVGSARHIIHESVNGFVVPAGNIESLADSMNYYSKNPEMAKIHGSRSLQIVSDLTPIKNVSRLKIAIETWTCVNQ